MKTLTVAAAALCLLVPMREQDAGKDDTDRIRGTWKVVTALDGGVPQPDQLAWTVVIDAERLTLRGEKFSEAFAYRLDPTRTPKWLDLTSRARSLRAIYQLQGDRLTICLNERPDGDRPTAFESRLNSPNDILLVLQREKR